jgi:hypothetical protein
MHACPLAQVLLPDVGDVGFKQAMQQKWLGTDKSSGAPMIVRKVCSLAGGGVPGLRAWRVRRCMGE